MLQLRCMERVLISGSSDLIQVDLTPNIKHVPENKPVEMAEKTKEDRVKEAVQILTQLKGTGVDPELSYKLVKEKVDDWVKTGDPWSGKIPFPECNRVAEIVLPRKAMNTATLLFRVKK